MTNLRSLTVTTAAAAVVFALVLSATPAIAAPTGFPPVVPYPHGPSVPPIPQDAIPHPFDLIHPDIVLPPCESVISASAIAAARAMSSRFTSFGQYAAATTVFIGDPTLHSIAIAEPHRACKWEYGTSELNFTSTEISSNDYNVLIARYRALTGWSAVGGTPGVAGTSADTSFALTSGRGPFTEWAMVSSDGWWIHIQDIHSGMTPWMLNEAVSQFLRTNPARR